jgi:hypothetical protein
MEHFEHTILSIAGEYITTKLFLHCAKTANQMRCSSLVALLIISRGKIAISKFVC